VESQDANGRYDKLIAEWLDRGRVVRAKPRASAVDRVDDFGADYFEHLETRFAGSREPRRMSYALVGIAMLFGSSRAAEISLPRLRVFRETQIRAAPCPDCSSW